MDNQYTVTGTTYTISKRKVIFNKMFANVYDVKHALLQYLKSYRSRHHWVGAGLLITDNASGTTRKVIVEESWGEYRLDDDY